MNKKGQSMGIAIISAFVYLVIGISIVNIFFDDVISTKLNLSCSEASSISDGNKVVCLVVDSVIPYLIVLIISISLGIITDRLI